ncbi:MAG: triose-phosphate isomerase [Flavobacteriaceae bacterium]
MRKKIVAGNWKMNKTYSASISLAHDIEKAVNSLQSNDTKVILAPTFVNLKGVIDSLNSDAVEVVAQNMHFAKNGAYTGEISADMLKEIGVETVILGHSERREYFNETNARLAQKVTTVLENNMNTIFCFGEVLEDRKSNNHFNVVKTQITEGLFHISASDMSHIVLAYEPVWAIGTGETATPEQAQEMHAFIRNLIADKYSDAVANDVSILYGGSVKPANAQEIFSKPDVDGGLIGGAALNTDDFLAIVKASNN